MKKERKKRDKELQKKREKAEEEYTRLRELEESEYRKKRAEDRKKEEELDKKLRDDKMVTRVISLLIFTRKNKKFEKVQILRVKNQKSWTNLFRFVPLVSYL